MASKPEMHAAFCVTDSYVDFCAITLASLCDNNPESVVVAHILTEDITPANTARLQALCERWGGTAHVHDVTALMKPWHEAYTFAKFHISVLYRLFMAEVLPASTDRALFLDCDMIVRRSLRSFYDSPFDGNAVLASRDISMQEAKQGSVQHECGVDYFNTGMLLVNLTYWREHNVSAQCLALYLEKGAEHFPCPDQDLLNLLLRDKVGYVSNTYNCLVNLLRYKFYRHPNAPKPDKAVLQDPHIVHFYASRKPWLPRVLHTYHDDYFKYNTIACGRRVILMPAWQYWLQRATYILPIRLGLYRNRYMTQRYIAQLPD